MEVVSLSEIPKEHLKTLLAGVSFFKELNKADKDQFNSLLKSSSFYRAQPGEEIIKRGDTDSHFYFLLKGLLMVQPEKERQEYRVVNHIHPGHDFGALSVLTGEPRMASVSVDGSEEALLFGTDFTLFGKLDDFSGVNLTTKLIFHRNVMNSIRWKLIVYGMSYPESDLAQDLIRIKTYLGEKNTFNELQALHDEILELSHLLKKWNDAFMNPGQFRISEKGLEMLPSWSAD
jgi:hypothetical protein